MLVSFTIIFKSPKNILKKILTRPSKGPQAVYPSSVWDPYTQENQCKLEMIQRRHARYVKNDYSYELSITEMIWCLGRPSLQQHRPLGWMINAHVAVDCSSCLIPVTRQSRHIHSASYLLSYKQKKYIQLSFLPKPIAQWNSPPEKVATAPTLDAFKSGVSVH